MFEIAFIYNGKSTIIQCNKEEKMKQIFNKFKQKSGLDINSLYFVYSGNKITNDELNFEMIANNEDKLRRRMNIIVNDKNSFSSNSSIIKSNVIICPKCYENIKLIIKDYKIFLYECKNNHEIDNISFNKFEETQKIDISKIKWMFARKKTKVNHIIIYFIDVIHVK